MLGPNPRLTVLNAPAGFGKTTLLCQWRAALLDQRDRVAWLSIDEGDDDPDDFAAALLLAVEAAGQPAGTTIDLIGRGAAGPWKQVLTELIGKLEATSEPLWLMFDDYHRVRSDGVGEAMAFLLSHVPDCLQIVLAGRSKPRLALAQMRAANRLRELSAGDLRFDLDETRRFFLTELPAEVDLFDMERLVELTQGWPAGLRMAAQDLTLTKRRKDALTGFANLSENVENYFEECVIADMPPDELVLLSRASILDELNHSLCAAVAGEDGIDRLFRRLKLGELFAERVDDKGEHFKLHPLFQKCLRSRLDRMTEADPRTLHGKASGWFAQRQDWPQAVHHAFASGNTAQALEWAEQCALTEVGRGNLSTVLGWVGRIPYDELLHRRPLLAAAGTAYALSLRLEDARTVAAAIETVIASSPPGPDIDRLSLYRKVLRICIAYMSDDGLSLLSLAKEFHEPGAAEQTWPRSVICNAFVHGYLIAGDIGQARASEWRGPVEYDDPAGLFSAVCQICLLGLCDVAEGHLEDAERRFRDALDLAEQRAGWNSAPTVLCASLLATVRYEQDDLDDAEALVVGRLELVEQTCFVEALQACYLTLARVHVTRRQWQAAHSLLGRGAELGRKRDWLRLRGACTAERLRICLLQGRTAPAQALLSALRSMVPAKTCADRSPGSYVGQLVLLSEGRILQETGKPQQACIVLDRYIREASWDDYSALQAGIPYATALLACGKRGQALEAMADVIVRSEAGGLLRSFADAGPTAVALAVAAIGFLRESGDGRASPDYLARLSDTLGRAASDPEANSAPFSVWDPSVQLTARERDLLARVQHGMTNKEIAQDLDIGIETVKWHLKNVFGKLKAKNRTEAIAHLQQIDKARSPAIARADG